MHASPYQEFEHSVLMRGIKLCANTEGIREQGGKIGAFDKACDC